jgi:hypothetical protein
MQKMRTEFRTDVDGLRSEVANRFNTSDSKLTSVSATTNSLSTNVASMASGMDAIMAFITATKAATTSVTPAPAPAPVPLRSNPAQQQIPQQQQQMQQTQHVLNTPASPLPPPLASTSLASLLPTSLIPASTVALVVASVATPIPAKVKDNFKPTPRDKQTQNVFYFARQFYKATKDKPLDRIEDALMNLESNDYELSNLLKVRTETGPSAHLSGTPEEWSKYLRCCNLRSLFLKPTAYIQDVKNQILKEQIDFYNFQQEPRK